MRWCAKSAKAGPLRGDQGKARPAMVVACAFCQTRSRAGNELARQGMAVLAGDWRLPSPWPYCLRPAFTTPTSAVVPTSIWGPTRPACATTAWCRTGKVACPAARTKSGRAVFASAPRASREARVTTPLAHPVVPARVATRARRPPAVKTRTIRCVAITARASATAPALAQRTRNAPTATSATRSPRPPVASPPPWARAMNAPPPKTAPTKTRPTARPPWSMFASCRGARWTTCCLARRAGAVVTSGHWD